MNNKVALSIMAHPDDAEFLCTGTFNLLHEREWEIHIATMTPGDLGSVEYNPIEISAIRRKEAKNSAKNIDGTYHCLESRDNFIMYDPPTICKAIKLIRTVKPTLVITHSPSDYMVDHEMTSKITQTACFSAGMVNLPTENVAAFDPIPYLYYADPLEGKDKFGNPIIPTTVIDISTQISKKEEMLCCHKSQRDWLLKHHGIDEYINTMKQFGMERGKLIQKMYAEGFRQHLGHAFPQENLLKIELENYVNEQKQSKY
jgi:LmbE family N-acetylglucosaminyl deacetylase